jgi:hypothetical protein
LPVPAREGPVWLGDLIPIPQGEPDRQSEDESDGVLVCGARGRSPTGAGEVVVAAVGVANVVGTSRSTRAIVARTPRLTAA